MPILYHYTSIDTLLLILKNMTLRFKSLGYVDDPLEPTTSDFGNLGTWKYVTCWSEVPESIPMWNMYADNMKGVCIGISFDEPTDIFYTEKYTFPDSVTIDTVPFLNPKDSMFLTSHKYVPTLDKIIYTDDKSLITPKVVSFQNGEVSIDLSKNGIYKTTDWAFQKEQRFSLQILPVPKMYIPNFYEACKEYGFHKMMKFLYSVKFLEHIDLLMNVEILNRMIITFGKNCTEDMKKEVKIALGCYEQCGLHVPLLESTANIRSLFN